MILFQVLWFTYFENKVYKKTGKHISLIKFGQLVNQFISEIFRGVLSPNIFYKMVEKHCIYETRGDRINSMESYYSLVA